MKGFSRFPDEAGGSYKMGYTVIAAAMSLALLVTIPLVADSLSRTLGLFASAFNSLY